MSFDIEREALGPFLVFCRVGACFMLLPGFSSGRVPTSVRLWLAGAVALALSPIVAVAARTALEGAGQVRLACAVMGEVFVGIALGLVLRVLFAALETMATAVALSLGLSSVFAPVEGDESQPSISIFLTLGATTLVFASDLHLEMLRGIAESYTAIPVATGLKPAFALDRLVDALSTGFALCLRLLSGPMVFSLFANVAGGLLNRLAPQIQAYFLAAPFVLGGGLYLLYSMGAQALALFSDGFAGRVMRW